MQEAEPTPADLSVPVHFSAVPRFDVSDTAGFTAYLEANGYVVIANVASASEIAESKTQFWDFVESIGHMRRHEPATWIDDNWLPNRRNGIFSSRGVNHSPFAWNIRCLPKVKEAFAAVWQTNELLVSFDATNVFRPWTLSRDYLTKGGWWHVDQNALKGPERQGKVCVQGLVTLYDATPHTGGLCVIPRSHLQHDAFCQRAPNASVLGDFVPIEVTDSVFETDGVLVGAKAGDLVLWDSRTIHCNTPALTAEAYFKAAAVHADAGTHSTHTPADTAAVCADAGTSAPAVSTDTAMSPAASTAAAPSLAALSVDAPETAPSPAVAPDTSPVVPGEGPDIIRLVAYVCMVPRRLASATIVAQRKFEFRARIGTSHWPVAHDRMVASLLADGVAPEDTAEEACPDPAKCPREMLQLVGYSGAEINALHAPPTPRSCGLL